MGRLYLLSSNLLHPNPRGKGKVCKTVIVWELLRRPLLRCQTVPLRSERKKERRRRKNDTNFTQTSSIPAAVCTAAELELEG